MSLSNQPTRRRIRQTQQCVERTPPGSTHAFLLLMAECMHWSNVPPVDGDWARRRDDFLASLRPRSFLA